MGQLFSRRALLSAVPAAVAIPAAVAMPAAVAGTGVGAPGPATTHCPATSRPASRP